jgi:cation transport ATPase
MASPTTSSQLQMRIQRQFGLLVFQFLLGMAVNLLGDPKDLNAFGKIAERAILGLHVLTAIGLVVGAIMINRLASQLGPKFIRLAGPAAMAIGLAFVFGVATVSAPLANLWSYLMAAAFIATLVLYGRLLSQIQSHASANSRK